MTNPRRPSLFQARDSLPHVPPRPRPHAHSKPLARAERHRPDILQSQTRSGEQHSSRDLETEDRAAPDTQGRPRDADDDTSRLHDRDLYSYALSLENDIVADALADVPLASQVTGTDPLSHLVGSTVGSTVPFVPAEATPLVPTVPNPSDLPDLPDLTAIESTLRDILTAALPLDTTTTRTSTSTSPTITTADPGSSPVPTASIPPPVLANASAQASTSPSFLTSSQAVLTPSAAPSWPGFPFSNGRNGTVTRIGTAESSRTQTLLPSMPSMNNGTQHRLGGAPKNMTAVAHLSTGVPSTPRPPTTMFTTTSQATPSESPRSSTALFSGEALPTSSSTSSHVTEAPSHKPTPSSHSGFRSVPSPTPMTVLDAPQPSASVSTTSGGGPNLSTQQKQVIGGVIGSVAGVTFLALLVMLVLKRRRRADGHGLSYLAHATATRGLLSGPRDGPGGPSPASNPGGTGGAMTEREAPTGVAAALGGLIGRQGARPASSVSSGERGFYRVSGKKLPSVLQVGGDGYTDPRESGGGSSSNYNQSSNTTSIINTSNLNSNIVITTTAPTNNNNDNIIIINNNNYNNRPITATAGKNAGNNLDIYQALRSYDSMDEITSQIALGNPMRPISGIPIIRSGPVRTPVTITEANPFDDRPSTPAPDGPLPSPVPRDSPLGSRFLENIRYE